mmetsp:Transcript_2831/g.5265  ORF Transcript_2831/g.5265 Transcript_2831/m.5265 type:complete len:338 (-) Transcript_2831:197-1210(-)
MTVLRKGSVRKEDSGGPLSTPFPRGCSSSILEAQGGGLVVILPVTALDQEVSPIDCEGFQEPMETDEWIVVTKARRKPHVKSIRHPTRDPAPRRVTNHGHHARNPQLSPEEKYLWVCNAVETSLASLEVSTWFGHLWAGICELLPEVETPTILDLFVYGLGSFEESPVARTQLSLAVLLTQRLQSLTSTVHLIDSFLHDPIMTDLDRRVADHFGFHPMAEHHCDGFCSLVIARHVSGSLSPQPRRRLFLMPHCARSLYNHVLSSNWTTEQRSKIWIIGNRFSFYAQKHTQPEDQSYVERSAVLVAERACLDASTSPDYRSFNDLALHHFVPDQPHVM